MDWIVASQLDWRCCMSKEELSQPGPCFFSLAGSGGSGGTKKKRHQNLITRLCETCARCVIDDKGKKNKKKRRMITKDAMEDLK